MATTEVQTAMANEARRRELEIKLAMLQGGIAATAQCQDRLTTLNSDSARQAQSVQGQLDALKLGAGPGITDDFGWKSNITQLLESERAASKSAAIDYIVANPECSEEDAIKAWNQAGIAFHSEIVLSEPMQSGRSLGLIYRQNLFNSGRIQENTWGAHRAWILATPKDIIMGL